MVEGTKVADVPESNHGLYLVAVSIPAGARRQRVREVLSAHGHAINADTYEVPTTARGIRSLLLALTPELEPGDVARVYPVCRRCQTSVQLYGEGDLARLPVAYVY
jgi:hypothetical protein